MLGGVLVGAVGRWGVRCMGSSQRQRFPAICRLWRPSSQPLLPRAAAGMPQRSPARPTKPVLDRRQVPASLKKARFAYYPPEDAARRQSRLPSTVKTFEIIKLEEGDPQVLARLHYGAPMIGTVRSAPSYRCGGETLAKFSTRFCKRQALAGHRAGRLDVRRHGKADNGPADTTPVYQIVPGERVPVSFTSWSRRKSRCQWGDAK